MDWRKMTIAQALRQASRNWTERDAILSRDQSLSFGELYYRACQLAAGLAKIGIKKGDHVATIFGIVPEWVITKYALHILGAVLVPVNVNYAAKEIEFILKQADIKALITFDELGDKNYLEMLTGIDSGIASSLRGQIHSTVLPDLETVITFSPKKEKYAHCYDFGEVLDSGARFNKKEIDEFIDRGKSTDVCNILYTSGSTAFPKGVVHIHTSLLGIGANYFGIMFDLKDPVRLLGYFPFYHIAGCVYLILGGLMLGSSVYLTDFVADEVLSIIEKDRTSVFGGFTAHFTAIANSPRYRNTDLSSVKYLFLAAGPEWYERSKGIFPSAEIIANHYGFSEGTAISVLPDEMDYEIRKNSNGKPWEGTDVKIVDPTTGKQVKANEPGEICLRGWSRFQEYYKNPEETRKAIDSEGYFHSGDYGWLDEKGNVYYRGRFKMMVKSGGENVSEREVEIFLEGMPGVKSVQVVGVPDEKWGEAVTAVFELEPGKSIEKESVNAYCKGKIAKFKIPKNVLQIAGSEWPLLGAGKVNKIVLKEWAIEQIKISN